MSRGGLGAGQGEGGPGAARHVADPRHDPVHGEAAAAARPAPAHRPAVAALVAEVHLGRRPGQDGQGY